MGIDLPIVWAVIILFAVMMYVVMDGFDLGIGLLFPFVRDRGGRDVMVNTVAPVWDGNETWLVLGGAGLFAAFPAAYSIVLEALSVPIVLMLVGLVFRGVAFEFRFKAPVAARARWDIAFCGGSAVAAFFQGIILGAFLDGLAAPGKDAGGSVPWLSPFPLFTGLGLLVEYGLLGATWLVMKTEGRLQMRFAGISGLLSWAFLGVIAIVSVWTPFAHPRIADRWFSYPNLLWFAPVPLLVGIALRRLRVSLGRAPGAGPFLWTLLLVFLGYSGLGISLWPFVVPPVLTIRDAAGPPQSLGFTLVGALLVIPVILTYTGWSYWVFRGKVRAGEGYH
ncbi:cyanide-insensitive cytochrome bd quinol oxidase subunit II [Castellaniella daejeonensis]|jgi:cytochrome d ubiquinol oxidase subunit II|uniref:Cyanide-insensitive cytochrome bd quinol oxidase subunit II n=1 Tax=Castellaniella daejeonensis TaxID=659013 RepID=A0ABP3D502_9BURK